MQMKDEQLIREQLVEYGNKLLEEGLVQGTWGNLSQRLDEDWMLVTPSGLDYTRLTPADMVKVNIHTLEYEGDLKPTSEKGLHAGLYEERPEVGAVVHTHCKYCCIFAAARMPLQVDNPEYSGEIGNLIQVADYGIAGTKTLAANTVKAVGSGAGAIMSNHGMICVGSDMENAFHRCVVMEQAARETINWRMGVRENR